MRLELSRVLWDALTDEEIASLNCLGRYGYKPWPPTLGPLLHYKLVGVSAGIVHLTPLGRMFFSYSRRRCG
jgi:hypothetical protein